MSSADRVRVLMGTSEGPVALLRLRRESRLVRRSQVTIGGSTRHADISRGYDAFVVRRTGIIHRLFHQTSAFRAEVSAEIAAGSSWQLGLFAIHALASSDRLAAIEEYRSVTLWATGTVRMEDLSIGAVGHIARKLTASLPILAAAVAAGERVIVAFPAANNDQVGPSLRKALISIGAEIVEAETAIDVVRKLDLPAIALAAAGTSSKTWGGSPFPGLESFDSGHRDVFFGRDRAREEILSALRKAAAGEAAFLLVHGRSGSGKSSLVRAGLVGDVAIQACEADMWRTCILSPGQAGLDPVGGLVAALADTLPEAKISPQAEPDVTAEAVAHALAATRSGRRCKLLLVVDQLEELLIGAPAAGREAFADILAALAGSGSVWVVATLRSDLLPRIQESPALSRLRSDDRMYLLEDPNRRELGDIIRRPALAARLVFEGTDPAGQPLAEVLLEAAASSTHSLPLLQFVLARMFAIDGGNGRLTYDTYAKLGKLEGAIGRWSEETVAELIKSGVPERAIDQVVLSLGRFERETGAIVARIAEADSTETDGRRVLEAFRRARLITLDDTGGARVAHEAVLTHWVRATTMFMENRRESDLRDLIETEAARWQQESRAPAFLIPPGLRASEAELFIKGERVIVSPLARDFVDASTAAARKAALEERQRLRRLTWAAIAAAVVMGTLAISAGVLFVKEGQQVEATNQEIDLKNKALAKADTETRKADAEMQKAQAIEKDAIARKNIALNGRGRLFAAVASHYNEEGDHGTALSVALAGISETQESGSPVPSQLQLELFVAQNELRERATFQGRATGFYNRVPALSPDGKLLAACAPHALLVWDVYSKIIVGKVPDELDAAGICNAAFSPDGQTIVFAGHVKTGSDDKSFRIRRFDTALASTQFDVAYNGDALSVAFTPDGKYLVVFGEGWTSFLDPSSGQTLWSTPYEVRSRTWRYPYEVPNPGALSSDSTLMVRVVGARVDIWDITAKQKVSSLDNMLTVDAVAISPDRARLVTASFDGIARVWDIATRREVFGLAGHSAGILCVAYSPDGSLILTCSRDGTARLWDAESGRPVATLRGRRSRSAAVMSGSFSADGAVVVTHNAEGDITFWDVSPAVAPVDSAIGDLRAYASFDHDERAIPFSISYSPVPTEPFWPRHVAIAMLDVRTRMKIASATFAVTESDNIAVKSMQVCKGDNRVLIDLTAKWQVRDATLVNLQAEAKKGPVSKAVFSPDCKSVVVAYSDYDTHWLPVVQVVSAVDGHDVAHRTLDKGESSFISSLEFSADGQSLVIGVGGSIAILDPNDLRERKRSAAQGGEMLFAIPSTDGRLVVTASGQGGIFVWNTTTDTYTDLGSRKAAPKFARFSKDGKRLVMGFLDGVALVWDTDNFEQIARVDDHHVADAAFTDDGRHLLLVTRSGVRMTSLYGLDELVTHAKSISVRDLDASDQAQILSLVPQKSE
ncbi:WD40 repeat protein [Bradyrhizobium sp. LB9.1b]